MLTAVELATGTVLLGVVTSIVESVADVVLPPHEDSTRAADTVATDEDPRNATPTRPSNARMGSRWLGLASLLITNSSFRNRFCCTRRVEADATRWTVPVEPACLSARERCS